MEPIKQSKKQQLSPVPKLNWTLMMGAAFLMATSAIGPGFLTQTTVFTQTLAASFGFVILVSIILDIFAQTNVWRIIAVSEKRGQDIANMVLPGLGYVIAGLIVMGGLAFNVGNIAGAGLGLNALFGIAPEYGAIVSAIIAVAIFLIKEAGKAMDRFTQYAGFVMIGLMFFVAFKTAPPVGEAVVKTVMPDTIDIVAIVTLVGGTVGGYITFAGGHRLLDAGIKGVDALPQVTKSSVVGILITSVMRIALFLAVLGVVSQGLQIDASNPPASVFQLAAGNIGYKIFGVVMWSAAITSVIGAAYTSVSFIRTFSKRLEQHHKWVIIGFIIVSTLCFVVIGKPVKVLLLVGAINGLILPIALGTLLVAAYRKDIVGDYKHPLWLTISGSLVVIVMALMGGYTLIDQLPLLFK
ncbi:divalent metal cation transporter [Priestia flexa]|jgi:Mn2+/Fe2+ NRAMP family transporter|uniref:Divalent metal cation transporter n=1 Tax=Priestia flexa TaxID=86664 RepID=A0A8I1MF62_9BACI|nr:NRAMP family divalent metal transporter [Priestia flexa]MBN8251290.1 divalent metal cation transporter [Priestia flexa]MBN8434447.1 divalent metal cation transporter [Priestia flexa]MCA0966768.1 divalent metal cation transporter [Priestia flexa]RIV05298.1 divalent metal cation transporter [Priestia flexa]UIR31803.1 divalent metal cation transporter [Priestia flexa]